MLCVFFDKTFEITQQAGCMSEGLTQWLGFGCARRFISDLAWAAWPVLTGIYPCRTCSSQKLRRKRRGRGNIGTWFGTLVIGERHARSTRPLGLWMLTSNQHAPPRPWTD